MTDIRFPSVMPAPGPEAEQALPTINWDEVQMPVAPPVLTGAEAGTTEQSQEQGEPSYLVASVDINDDTEIEALAKILGIAPEEVRDRLEQGVQAGERGATLWHRLTPEAQERHRAAASRTNAEEPTPEPLLKQPAQTPTATPVNRDVKMRVVGANEGDTRVVTAVPKIPARRAKKAPQPTIPTAAPVAPDLKKTTDKKREQIVADPVFYTGSAKKYFKKAKHHDKILTEAQFHEFFGDDALAADPDLKAEYSSVHPVYAYDPLDNATNSIITIIPEKHNILGWRYDTVRDQHGKKVKLPKMMLAEDPSAVDNTTAATAHATDSRTRKKRRIAPTVSNGSTTPPAILRNPEPSTSPDAAEPPVFADKAAVDAYFAQRQQEFLDITNKHLESVAAEINDLVETRVAERLAQIALQAEASGQTISQIITEQTAHSQDTRPDNDNHTDHDVAAEKTSEKRRRQLAKVAKIAGASAVTGMGVAVALMRKRKR